MRKRYLRNSIILLTMGICIGVLAGLSVSPVIQSVLTALLALIISAVSILAGLQMENSEGKEKLKYQVDALPMGLLVMGITVGCLTGIYMRTHDVLSRGNSHIKEAGQGPQTPQAPPNDMVHSTVQFSVPAEICDVVKIYEGKVLIDALKGYANKHVDSVIAAIGEGNPKEIKTQLGKLCEK